MIVFVVVCVAIDLIRHRPIHIFTAARVVGLVGIALAMAADALHKQKGTGGANKQMQPIAGKPGSG